MDKSAYDHYKNIAETFGLSSRSTMKDPFIRESEVQFFIGEINRFHSEKRSSLRVLDIGCGNGYLISRLVDEFPSFEFVGIEPVTELYEHAVARSGDKALYTNASILDHSYEPNSFDIIMTERVVINIKPKKWRDNTFNLIHKYLKPQGRYLMVESFKETLVNLNRARRQFNLDDILEPDHNKYISEMDVDKMRKLGLLEMNGEFSPHYLSTHFFNTRVLHNLLRPQGGQVEENELVSFLDQAFGPAIGEYSPIQFRVFEKL